MKLNYVIVSSNEDKTYSDCWHIVSKTWKEIMGLTPVMASIDEEESDFYSSEYGIVKKFKRIDGISTAFQSQVVRLFLPKLLEGYCLISDVDMIPLSKNYFESNSEFLTESNFLVFSSDCPETLSANQYPMCYIAGHSDTFYKIFDLQMEWEEFCWFLYKRNESKWCIDQEYVFDQVTKYHEQTGDVVFLKRGWGGGYAHNRVDRASWAYNPEEVKKGTYVDCHMLRPWVVYKDEINKLVNLLY